MDDAYTYVDTTGTIVPDTADILTQVQDEYKTVFGADLIVTPDTPQGVLITVETLARATVADNNAAIANQINPNLAGGVFLDAILALTGSQRTTSTYTIVSCNLTGVSGTIIPQGSLAQDTLGNQYASQAAVTLAAGMPGTATVNFVSLVPGPITVSPSTLIHIMSSVLGWETITNPAAQSVIGSATQSDLSAKVFRINTLFAQGSSLAGAITSALYAVPGVSSLSFLENIAPTTQVISGVTMIGHSIYTCVNGGTDIDIANALVAKKSGGAAYNNGASSMPVTETITVPFSNQIMNILFDRPDPIPVLVKVTASVAASIQDPEQSIINAVLAYANNDTTQLGGEPGLLVGTSVSCFEIAGAINRLNPAIYLHNVQTSLASSVNYANTEIAISVFQIAQIIASNITVVLV